MTTILGMMKSRDDACETTVHSDTYLVSKLWQTVQPFYGSIMLIYDKRRRFMKIRNYTCHRVSMQRIIKHFSIVHCVISNYRLKEM